MIDTALLQGREIYSGMYSSISYQLLGWPEINLYLHYISQ